MTRLLAWPRTRLFARSGPPRAWPWRIAAWLARAFVWFVGVSLLLVIALYFIFYNLTPSKNVFLWQGGGYVRKALEAWFTVLIEHIWGKRRIMEVYLNVAETGIGTYGAEAGAQRYYGHPAARLSTVEAARIAAALPSPKTRDVVGATGFVRRHGNVIAARSNVVRSSEFDGCVYQ